MLEGLRKAVELIVIVVTRFSYGCPTQAIVHAFEIDERTVARWQERAGVHCQRVHYDQVVQGKLDLHHVQADEIRGKGCQMIPWIAMAMMVSTRLWLGGVVSLRRDRRLADQLLQMVKTCCLPLRAVLVLTDGWSAYPGSIRRAFREKVKKTAGPGRCHLQAWGSRSSLARLTQENGEKARRRRDSAHGARKPGAGQRPVGTDDGRKGVEHGVHRTLQWNPERASGKPDEAVSACCSARGYA